LIFLKISFVNIFHFDTFEIPVLCSDYDCNEYENHTKLIINHCLHCEEKKHIRILTASLLFVAMVLFSQSGWCQEIQEVKITGSFSKTPLQEVFSSLENKYGIHFFYKTAWIASKDFTGSFDNQPLIQVVNRIVEGKELNSRFFQNNSVFVFPANADKDLVTSKEESKMLVVGDPINQGRFKRAKIQGRVFEGKTGDPLMGAVVYNPETKVGVASDARGRYSIDLPTGQVHLQVSFMSFENQYFSINLIQDGKVDFDLFEKSFSIAELTVLGESSKASKAQMSMIKMSSITVKELPVLMGEADLIKSMVMMPGVQSVGEMSSGFNVRGGNTDQNLVLLDGAPVFNTTHLFGFFSMINPDAVDDVTLYKGGIPASYGERISSVMDVQFKKGTEKNLSVNGGIGHINSRLTIEGPLTKKKKRHEYPFYGVPTETVHPALFIDLPDFTGISRELLPGVKFRAFNRVPTLNILNPATLNYFNDPPLVLLNGIPVQDLNVIKKMGSKDIDRIEICRRERFYGDLAFPGVVAIYSSKQVNKILPESDELIKLNLDAIQPEGSLNIPKEHVQNEPDLRKVLLWQPGIKTAETITLDFETSDIKGSYKVIVRGITRDGEVIYNEQFFEVN